MEAVATIVILGIALATVTTMMTNTLSSSANTYEETRTTALARAYLDEILSRRFDENSHPSGTPACDGAGCTAEGAFGPDAGEGSRDKWDDVDDYDGLDEIDDDMNDLLDAEGDPRAGYTGYRVTVSVTYAGDLDPIFKEETDAKLITVTVYTPPGGTGTEFQVYKANY